MQLIKPNWAAPAHIHAYSTTRLGGVSEGDFLGLNLGQHVGDDSQRVANNRLLLAEYVAPAPDFCWLTQTHSTHLIKLSAQTPQNQEADASWTDNNARTCVVMTADCLPVLVTNQQGTFVAAIHAGWRGLCDGIIEQSIEQICAQQDQKPEQLLVWFGPCIGPDAFEVGEEVRAQFIAHDPLASDAFIASHRQGKWLANLQQLATLRLTNYPDITLSYCDSCTYQNSEQFYSYRRDGRTGRLATFIWMD